MRYIQSKLFMLCLLIGALVSSSCSEEDSGPITFSFEYTWNAIHNAGPFPLFYDADGGDIGGSDVARLHDMERGETRTIDITINRGGEVLQISTFVDNEPKRVFTNGPVNNGDLVSWDTADNTAFVNDSSGGGDQGGSDETCKEWVVYNTECLSSVPDGTGSSKAGVRSRVCRLSHTDTEITIRAEVEAINGGIDNIDFYKGLKIFFGDGSTETISKEEFNSKQKIVKEYTVRKSAINNQGKDWDELSSTPYLVIWCENN